MGDYNKRYNFFSPLEVGKERREMVKLKKKNSQKIMAENFPDLTKNINLQIPEDEKTPSRVNPKKSIP